jgi:hypothetical protein
MRKESPASGVVTIKLPLPPAALSANPRGTPHWRTKQDAKVAYRELATAHTKNAMHAHGFSAPFQHRVKVVITFGTLGRKFNRNTYAPKDEGNAVQSLKAAFDGVVNGGLLADDESRYLTIGEVIISKEEPEGVTLRFEELLSSGLVSEE